MEFLSTLNRALMILSWRENLTSDEMPPSWMHHLDWEPDAWFTKVNAEREAKYGVSDKKSQIEEPDEKDKNDYFSQFKEQLK